MVPLNLPELFGLSSVPQATHWWAESVLGLPQLGQKTVTYPLQPRQTIAAGATPGKRVGRVDVRLSCAARPARWTPRRGRERGRAYPRSPPKERETQGVAACLRGTRNAARTPRPTHPRSSLTSPAAQPSVRPARGPFTPTPSTFSRHSRPPVSPCDSRRVDRRRDTGTGTVRRPPEGG